MRSTLCAQVGNLCALGRSSDQPDLALSATIRAARLEAKRTQEDLAHNAGITVTSLRRLEAGTVNPAWTTVRRLAAALGLDLEELGRRIDAHS